MLINLTSEIQFVNTIVKYLKWKQISRTFMGILLGRAFLLVYTVELSCYEN